MMTSSAEPLSTLGVYANSLADRQLTFAEAVRLAHDAGLRAILFPWAISVDPELEAAALADARAWALSLDVEVSVGLANLHPHRVSELPDILRLGCGDPLSGLVRLLEASALFGHRDLPVIIGRIEDRFNRLVPWQDQLDDWVRLVTRLKPVLLDLGVRLNVKTHEEITTFEAVRLVETLGSDVVSIGLDPVNVLVNGERPIHAAERVAKNAAHVYVDDATFAFRNGAFDRLLCPLGQGIIDWDAVQMVIEAEGRSIHYWIELHRGQFTVDPFSRTWTDHFPDLSPAEYAASVQDAFRSVRDMPDSTLTAIEAHQALPTTRLTAAVEQTHRMGLAQPVTLV